MSQNPNATASMWPQDIAAMHAKFNFDAAVAKMSPEQLLALRDFRIKFLEEELAEIKEARDPRDFVDGLIDLCVVAIGTLDAYGVDSDRAWNVVYWANVAKEVGVNSSRPNPLGLPDLVKPAGWTAPDHAGNTGTLDTFFHLLGEN